jgi:hypothetical protein
MTDHRVVTKWLLDLSQVVGSSEPVTTAKIVTMQRMLGDHFPDAAYAGKSLEAVASKSQYWPTYVELSKRLGDWWDSHKPAEPLQIGSSRLDGLSGDELRWVAYWHARLGEGFGPVYSSSPDEKSLSERRETILDLIRCQAPRAWERITGQQMPGRDPIAARMGAAA